MFYMVFSLIRSYAGGFHAKTERECTVCTTLSMLISVILIRVLETNGSVLIALVMIVVGAIFVFVFSPLDTEEKTLEPDDRRHYRYISIAITSAFVIIGLVAYFLKYDCFLISLSVSIFLEGFLLSMGKCGANT